MIGEKRYPPERLVPYDLAWSGRYAELASAITARSQWEVEHVGSTSVPGLLAKPVIYIALRVPEQEHVPAWVPVFRGRGWTDPVAVRAHQAMFLLDGGVRTAIAHVHRRTLAAGSRAPVRRVAACP